MRNNSHCCECGRPCRAPRGNWNAKSVSLCSSVVCRRKRKSALQKERRKQKTLPLGLSAGALRRAPLKKVASDGPAKAKARAAFGRGLRQAWKAGVNIAG
jgi:hypothetical protein